LIIDRFAFEEEDKGVAGEMGQHPVGDWQGPQREEGVGGTADQSDRVADIAGEA
jgi:hypothetical protein